jgi:septum formation protein
VSRPDLVLASKSTVRRTLLSGAGVTLSVHDAAVDEDAIKQNALKNHLSAPEIAARLATAKAQTVSALFPNALVIGCDQVLELDGNIFDKPINLEEARGRLRAFSGKTHQLIAAISLVQDGHPLWQTIDSAALKVRALSADFIETYIANEGEAVLSSVGAYRLESMGAQLFDEIDGDYFTVLGLPLLPLLEQLRKHGILQT